MASASTRVSVSWPRCTMWARRASTAQHAPDQTPRGRHRLRRPTVLRIALHDDRIGDHRRGTGRADDWTRPWPMDGHHVEIERWRGALVEAQLAFTIPPTLRKRGKIGKPLFTRPPLAFLTYVRALVRRTELNGFLDLEGPVADEKDPRHVRFHKRYPCLGRVDVTLKGATRQQPMPRIIVVAIV